MKNRLSFAFLAALSLVTIAGCPKKQAGNDSGAAIAKLGDLRDQMCKCTDKACADKVNEAYAKWGQDQAKANTEKPMVLGPDDMKKMTELTEAITQCTAKAIAGAAAMRTPPADPAAPAPAAGSDKPADAAAPAPGSDKPAAGSDTAPAGSGSAAP